MEKEEFEQLIEDILSEVPEIFKNRVENLSIIIDEEKIPPAMTERKKSKSAVTLALYEGVPMTKRSHGKPLFPDRITIYKKAIESVSMGKTEMVKTTRRVVLHELGHYFGLDEKKLSELGY